MLYSSRFKIPFLVIILLLIYSSTCCGNEKKRLLYDIKKNISACRTIEDAKHFLDYVQFVMNKVQNSFSELASHRYKKKEYKIKKNLLNNYFESDAWVQISSKNSSLLITQTIEDYLDRLTNYKYKYDKVKLYFDKEYLAFGKINEFGPRNNRSYEFNLAAAQIFEGYIGDYIRYSDTTIKVFNFIFKRMGKSWTLKIKCITAKETYTIEKYDEDKDTIWLKGTF